VAASAARSILCAVGGSEPSPQPVLAARRLAEQLDTHVVLAHVFDPMGILVPVPYGHEHALADEEKLVAEERDAAVALLDGAGELLDGVEHRLELVEGRPAPQLLLLAEEHRPRLLVAGTARRARVDLLLIGSVASELAARAPCPVLVVPADAPLDEPGPLLAAFDGSDHSRRAAAHAASLASDLERDLVLVQVAGGGDDALNEAASALSQEYAVRVAAEARDGEPVAVLVERARELAAPTIVAGTHGRGPVSAALVGSVLTGLVRTGGRAVAIVPPAAGATPRAR
jgi:nucleotide-binding universal stress UspA family protein